MYRTMLTLSSIFIGLTLALGASAQSAAPGAGPKVVSTKSGIRMALLPGGAFTMGNDAGRPDEKPAHVVTVGPFYIDVQEVLQSDFEKMTGINPAKFEGERQPVDQVRWFQAVEFCNERSRREGLTPCYDETTWQCNFAANGYRLPTEAEWEYAYRAGTRTKWYFGDSRSAIGRFAWFKENSGDQAHSTAKTLPNAFGLYDMAGNLWEWCNDYYDAGYYKASPAKDPTGPAKGAKRVLRGGSWATSADTCSASWRMSDDPANADICQGYDTYGFRCVRRP